MQPKLNRKLPSYAPNIPWVLTSIVALLAIFDWASSLSWHFAGISIYQIFPVLGLLAFSIMWSHYMAGIMKRTFLVGHDLDDYFRITGYAVLVAILLHPGLLAYQRLRDGFGLPPGSETSYVAPMLGWVVVLGMVSFFVFLAYEFKRWYGERKWWKYIAYAGDIAMLAIFYHGLRLGSQLHGGWYRIIWWFYGITLIGALLNTYIPKLLRQKR